MSKLDKLLEKYTADLEAIGDKVDAKLLRAVAKGCGPAIYRRDASLRGESNVVLFPVTPEGRPAR